MGFEAYNRTLTRRLACSVTVYVRKKLYYFIKTCITNVLEYKGNINGKLNPYVYYRAVRYHLKFAYHDSMVRVSRYILGIDTSHDMAYMR